jgi:hypothetical protein
MHLFLNVHPHHLMSCPVIGLQRAAQLMDDDEDDSPAEELLVPPVPGINGTVFPAAHEEADEMMCA